MNKKKVFIMFAVLIIAIIGISMPADAVLINEPYSGSYEWYSGMGDNLNNTLTQEFSLPAGAQLTFQTWYDIEENWDYGYVEASTDGGATWKTVAGNITTNTNPNGFNFKGNGITGNSGGWVDATFNLSVYGGQTVLLSFRYETDGAIQGPAWTIDDIAINGFFDDVESGSQGWTADGWYIMDGTTEPIPGQGIQELDDYIQDLDADDFNKKAKQRQKALHNSLEAVVVLIEAGEYQDAIDKLQNSIRAKADGSVDGDPNNDWITDPTAQQEICAMIDDITADLQLLL